MTVCMIYSGWLRTWELCRQNHADMLNPRPAYEVHYSELEYDLSPYAPEDWAEYYTNKAPENQPENTINMWHNMYAAWKMAPEGFDCYVRNRYDIVIEQPINFAEYEMRPDVVYIPVGNDFWEGVNDQFAFGGRAAMGAYFSVYLDHPRHFAAGKMFHSESYLKHTLDMRGISVVRVPVANRIIRG